MFRFIKKIIGLLTGIVNAFNHAKCVSLSNQKCTTQPILISLYPNKYTQRSRYFPFAVNSDICVWSYNTLNDLSNKVCISDNTKDLNLSILKMKKWINEFRNKWIKNFNKSQIMQM